MSRFLIFIFSLPIYHLPPYIFSLSPSSAVATQVREPHSRLSSLLSAKGIYSSFASVAKRLQHFLPSSTRGHCEYCCCVTGGGTTTVFFLGLEFRRKESYTRHLAQHDTYVPRAFRTLTPYSETAGCTNHSYRWYLAALPRGVPMVEYNG